MTNQTVVFSVLDISPGTGIATVTADVNQFINDGLRNGKMSFEIKPVVVETYYYRDLPTEKNWYTVQVNYYDPSVY